MATTTTVRGWWSSYRCLPVALRTPIQLFGRNAGYCAGPAYDAFKALEQALVATGYKGVRSVWIPRNCPTGIAGQTCSKSGSGCSLHNYGVAVDIDPFGYGNPHFQSPYGKGWDFSDCKITKDQVAAVEGIRNTNGDQLFRWLGWLIGDTQHFEIQVPPTRAKVNWTTVPGVPAPEPGPGGLDVVITRATTGVEATDFQRYLNDQGYTDAKGAVLVVDGKLGDKTFEAYAKLLVAIKFPAQAKGKEAATMSALSTQAARKVPSHGHKYAPDPHSHAENAPVKHGHSAKTTVV